MLLLENAFTHDEQKFRNEDEHLEEDIAAFTKDFRAIKKQVFNITEHMMETERLQHLLAA